MPLMAAWLCFTLPAGMGLYWVAGSVVRSIQQVVINKHIDKMDFDDIIQKNSAKSAKKLEKMKEAQERMNAYANMSTKSIQSRAGYGSGLSEKEKDEAMKSGTGHHLIIQPVTGDTKLPAGLRDRFTHCLGRYLCILLFHIHIPPFNGPPKRALLSECVPRFLTCYCFSHCTA